MADRGLQAYVVPSAQAGQQTDPAARRDALSGLMTGGFLIAVFAVVLAIVVAVPEYAEPVAGAGGARAADGAPAAEMAVAPEPAEAMPESPTSRPPTKLKGYRWPVRGGEINTYYEPSRAGRFVIGGHRVHTGLLITWFEGAAVKAAHSGKVLAAGRDWPRYIGYDGSLNEVYERLRRKGRKMSRGIVIDDGNGYRSVYTELKDLRVKVGDRVKVGQIIGEMSRSEKKQMMRYRLVRMDGPMMKVHKSDRQAGYPSYAREQVDPLVVFKAKTNRAPRMTGRLPPADPPRLSDY